MLFLLLLGVSNCVHAESSLEMSETINQSIMGDLHASVFQEIFLGKALKGGDVKGAVKNLETSYTEKTIESLLTPSSDGIIRNALNASIELQERIATLSNQILAFIERTRNGKGDISDHIAWAKKRSSKFSKNLAKEQDVALTLLGIQASIASAKTVEDITKTLDTLRDLRSVTDIAMAQIKQTLVAALAKSAEINTAQQILAEKKVADITNERAKSHIAHQVNTQLLQDANAKAGEEKRDLLAKHKEAQEEIENKERELDKQAREWQAKKEAADACLEATAIEAARAALEAAKARLDVLNTGLIKASKTLSSLVEQRRSALKYEGEFSAMKAQESPDHKDSKLGLDRVERIVGYLKDWSGIKLIEALFPENAEFFKKKPKDMKESDWKKQKFDELRPVIHEHIQKTLTDIQKQIEEKRIQMSENKKKYINSTNAGLFQALDDGLAEVQRLELNLAKLDPEFAKTIRDRDEAIEQAKRDAAAKEVKPKKEKSKKINNDISETPIE